MFRKFLPLAVCITCIGCATTGRNNHGIIEYPLQEFPAGYICTNLSLPYAEAAYGVLSGQVTPELLDDPLLYLFRPEFCDPNDPRINGFARDADGNHDNLLTQSEVAKELKRLKKKFDATSQ